MVNKTTSTLPPTKEESNLFRLYQELLQPGEVTISVDAFAPYGDLSDIAVEMMNARKSKDDEEGLKRYVASLSNINSDLYKRIVRILSGHIPLQAEPQPGQEQERRYQLHPLSYFKSRPKREWGIHQMIYDRGTSLFIGDGGSGKSTLVLNMYLARACEQTFVDKEIKPAFVIWVAAESVDEIYPRVSAWLKTHKLSEEELTNMLFLDERVPFNNMPEVEAFIESVREQLDENNIDLEERSLAFVFDTYARCTPGSDENNTQETKLIADSILHVADAFKAHVSVIHHMNAQGRIRGNTALRDAVDTVWNVTKEAERMRLHCDKMRGFLEPSDFYVKMRSIVLDDNNLDDSAPIIVSSDTHEEEAFTPKAQTQMLEILQAYGHLSCNQWAKHCQETHEIAERTFHSHLKSIVNDELVEMTQGGKPIRKGEKKTPGKPVSYTLTEKGANSLG